MRWSINDKLGSWKMFGDSNQEMQKAAALKVYLVKLEDIFTSEENTYEVVE